MATTYTFVGWPSKKRKPRAPRYKAPKPLPSGPALVSALRRQLAKDPPRYLGMNGSTLLAAETAHGVGAIIPQISSEWNALESQARAVIGFEKSRRPRSG
jgi:hypothetical protein